MTLRLEAGGRDEVMGVWQEGGREPVVSIVAVGAWAGIDVSPGKNGALTEDFISFLPLRLGSNFRSCRQWWATPGHYHGLATGHSVIEMTVKHRHTVRCALLLSLSNWLLLASRHLPHLAKSADS